MEKEGEEVREGEAVMEPPPGPELAPPAQLQLEVLTLQAFPVPFLEADKLLGSLVGGLDTRTGPMLARLLETC